MEVMFIPELGVFAIVLGDVVMTAPTVADLIQWLASAKPC